MKVIKRRGFEGADEYEYTRVARCVSVSGTPADKVQELIEVYEASGLDGDVPCREVVENLKRLKRLCERLQVSNDSDQTRTSSEA